MKVQSTLLLSWLLAFAFSQNVIATNHPRQATTGTATTPTTAPATTPTTAATTTPITPTTPVTTPTTATTSTPTTPTTTPAPPTTTATTPTTAPAPPTSAAPVTTPPPSTTDTGAVTVTQTNTASTTSDTSTPPPTHTPDTSSGLGVGPIIGMSVAGGIAVIAIIAFFIWKFSKKRFSDFDDGEAIKWPELNTHGGSGTDSHPLPLHNTGRSGFDTGSEASLSRVPSTSNYSTPDIGGVSNDPYAVPPLPHLNPNQPYRDDPNAPGYYDPYRGPVPNTLEHGADWSGEAFPMTQMAAPNAGRMSPAQNPYAAGRLSPGPQMAYGRTSPGPQAAYGAGRMSPGPHAAYGQ